MYKNDFIPAFGRGGGGLSGGATGAQVRLRDLGFIKKSTEEGLRSIGGVTHRP